MTKMSKFEAALTLILFVLVAVVGYSLHAAFIRAVANCPQAC